MRLSGSNFSTTFLSQLASPEERLPFTRFVPARLRGSLSSSLFSLRNWHKRDDILRGLRPNQRRSGRDGPQAGEAPMRAPAERRCRQTLLGFFLPAASDLALDAAPPPLPLPPLSLPLPLLLLLLLRHPRLFRRQPRQRRSSHRLGRRRRRLQGAAGLLAGRDC